MERLSRRHLLRRGVALAAFGLGVAGAVKPTLAGARSSIGVPTLRRLAVKNRGKAFVGDRQRFATISPRSLGGRRSATLTVSSDRRMDALFEVTSRHGAGQVVHSRTPVELVHGRTHIPWNPAPSTAPGSYQLRLRRAGNPPGPVIGQAIVRVLDVEATFGRRSALAGERVTLSVLCDAPWLQMTLLRCGPESVPTYSNSLMNGVPVMPPLRIDLRGRRDGPVAVPVTLPSDLVSGIYTARLDGPSGHVGFAPLVIRPTSPVSRVGVVLPLTTWQAYNFYDENGDGFGGTWYALWAQKSVRLNRPHLRRGVPYRWRSYELGFQQWLASRGHVVDTFADEDIERFPSATDLRAAYDLLIFPGHTEYVTRRLFDLVEGFRNAGGRLMFLSANNFFRHVERRGEKVKLIGEWRNEGRPEASLLGVQYLANDRGQKQQPFVVQGAAEASWAFRGTGLHNGSTFGRYGVEIDAVSLPSTPPGTFVLASIPDLFGPGRSAQMSYYETEAGARVFSAGVLNFGGTIMLWPEVGRLVDNVWNRLTSP
jgi:hypothetical protein